METFKLDESNKEFYRAVEFVNTNKLLYVTGKAGTGKTTFLKYIRSNTNKNIVVLAPTGVAAINAEGVTINSFFKIPFSPFVPDDKRLRTKADPNDPDKTTIFNSFLYPPDKLKIIRAIELLIIDEVSMIRCDRLDVIDKLMRAFAKKNPSLPFGGVPVVLIGDTFQLPPVAVKDEWNILSQFYDTPFFFSSRVIQQHKPIYIELKKIYRQSEVDFISLLNKVRINEMDNQDIEFLNKRYNPSFTPKNDENYITLAIRNDTVDAINFMKLNELPGEISIYEAIIEGDFPEKNRPTDDTLNLKVDSQVMFIKNDRDKQFYNGKIGIVKELLDDKIIVLTTEKEITVYQETWEHKEYTWNAKEKKIEENTIGIFRQFPLRLAWAITVHKSQGLTFEKVIADLNGSFVSGQVYVALSRCTSLNGLVLKTKISKWDIITAPEVIAFAKSATPETLLVEELKQSKADYLYTQSKLALKNGDFTAAYNYFISAIKHRNDLETKLFKKYFIIFSKRYFNQQLQLKHNQEEINSRQDKIKKLEEQNLQANHSFNQNLEALNNEAYENSKNLKDLYQQIAAEKNKSSLLLTLLSQSIDLIEKQNQQILNEKVKITEDNKKWYRKIFARTSFTTLNVIDTYLLNKVLIEYNKDNREVSISAKIQDNKDKLT